MENDLERKVSQSIYIYIFPCQVMQGSPKTFSNEVGRNEFWLQNRKLETIEAHGHYFQGDETFKGFKEVVGLLSCSFKEKVYFLIAISLGGLDIELAEA